MKRAITILTTIAIIIMTALTLANIDTPFRLFMGETSLDIIGRLAVLVGLIALTVTQRPRSMALRSVLGVTGITILAIAVSEIFSYQLAMFDALIYLIGSTSLIIEALEPSTAAQPAIRRAHA